MLLPPDHSSYLSAPRPPLGCSVPAGRGTPLVRGGSHGGGRRREHGSGNPSRDNSEFEALAAVRDVVVFGEHGVAALQAAVHATPALTAAGNVMG